MSQAKEYRHIGIDVSKYHLDVFDASGSREKRLTYDTQGLHQLFSWLNPQPDKPVRVYFEASGGYEYPLTQWLRQSCISYRLIHAKRLRDYARGMGRLAKTDRLDAKVIAQFGQANVLPEPVQPTPTQEALRFCQQRRHQLIGQRASEKCRLDKVHDAWVNESLLAHIAYLDEQIASLDARMQAFVAQDPWLTSRVKRLRTAPGIGPVVSMTLVCLLPELGTLSTGEIGALSGLAPIAHDSGQVRGRRYIQGGRAQVRESLYLATLTTIRVSPAVKSVYTSLVSKGKPKKLTITACARRLVVALNTMLKHECDWDEKRFSTQG